MKAVKLVFLCVCLTVLCGCGDYGEKRIVKLITISDEEIAAYCYDFEQNKPTYTAYKSDNNGIGQTLTEMFSDGDYTLKLCQSVIVEEKIIDNSMQQLVYALTDNRLSPDACIMLGNTDEECEKYIGGKIGNYPIYSYKMQDKNICGVVENADTKEKALIVDSQKYTVLSPDESAVFDILSGIDGKVDYCFDADGVKLLANLENVSLFYYIDDDILNITISALLKSYKGMPAGKDEKQQFIKLIQQSINNNAVKLLKDRVVAENYDLLWYKNVKKFDKIMVNVNII